MFIDRLELDPDLEWMLQSGQAKDQVIIDVLVDEFYPSILRLAFSLLGENQVARGAVIDSLATGLFESHRYSGMEGAHLWLLSNTVTTCRKAYHKLSAHPELATIKPQNVSFKADSQPKLPPHQQISYWLSVDSLSLDQRLLVVLRAVCDLSTADIAVVLGVNEQVIAASLKSAYLQITESFHTPITSDETASVKEIEEILRNWLQAYWSQPEPTSSEIEHTKAGVHTKVLEMRRRNQYRTRFKEISIIGAAIFLVAAIVGIANVLQTFQEDIPPPPQFGKPTPFPVVGNRTAIPTHRATIEAPSISPTPFDRRSNIAPLDFSSHPEDVYRRIRANAASWNTLWADVSTYFYGPRGYVGPALTYRQQFWIKRNESALLIKGPIDGIPQRFYWESLNSSVIQHAGLRRLVWGNFISWLNFIEDDLQFPATFANQWFFRESWFENQPSMHFVRSSVEILGHRSLVIDLLDQHGERFARLWVDVDTGLLLRERIYAENDPDTVIIDFMVNSLAIDEEFPPDLLEDRPNHPLRENFAADFSGRVAITTPEKHNFLQDPLAWRAPKSITPAPSDFDPSRSRLTFEVMAERDDSSVSDAGLRIYADDYLLAELSPEHPLASNPLQIACRRSPDGSILAFVDFNPFSEETPIAPVRWLHLSDTSLVHTSSENSWGWFPFFVFSPDSRYLAMTFADNHEISGDSFPRQDIYIIDTITGDARKQEVFIRENPLEEGTGLSNGIRPISPELVVVWSPDGRYIIAGPSDPDWDILAIDVHTGEAIPGSVTVSQLQTIHYSFPTLGLRGEFEFRFSDLSACVDPSGVLED